MKHITFILLLSALAACKKTLPKQAAESSGVLTRGLPPDIKNIHGLLSVSAYSANAYSYSYDLYVIFADPARDLTSAYDPCSGPHFDVNTCGNVNAGNIHYNNYSTVVPSTSGNMVFYNKSVSLTEPHDTVKWVVSGNGTFAKISEQINDPYPTFIGFPASKRKISISKPYIFYADSLWSGFDMVTVFIDDGYNPQYGIAKSAAGGTIEFEPEELQTINAANNIYFRIRFGGSRFYYKVIYGKTFVFQSTYKTVFNATILP